jgi:tetratricopeptide (TPR) repeat protein
MVTTKKAVILLMACAVCAAAFAQTPEDYFNRGAAHVDHKDYESAVADFTEAIRLKPDFAEAYYARGGAYLCAEDYDKAIADFTGAIRLKPGYAEAYDYRSAAYFFREDYAQAIADLEAVLAIKPNNAEAKVMLELARMMSGL